ncbi:hypothetical protein FHS27_001998 [Rhodopirellula rubra]|uniref:PqqD family protein n=1 Tax=Aporhodopirellula rubra TaxID=980271 RepID=A0A7W5DX63_9BACT|nr:PqqD family protein [Aporhodopirellula rubra]MBB3206190.1 hypothetical protein [Aporhodopirellula rubra]
MTSQPFYKLNEPQVVGELLDGEFILLHFETGCYFSVRHTSASVCHWLFAGVSPTEIADAIATHYGLPKNDVEQEIDAFIAGMLREDLVAVVDAPQKPALVVPTFDGAYTKLVFEKYDDMSEQLLLDPIHEIDERGWPQSKAT